MKKRYWLLSLIFVFAFVFVGCSNNSQNTAMPESTENNSATSSESSTDNSEKSTKEDTDNETKDEKKEEKVTNSDASKDSDTSKDNDVQSNDSIIVGSTIDEVESNATNDMNNYLNSLQEKYTNLKTSIDTYEKYKNDKEKVFDFYDEIVNDTKMICVKMLEYSENYAQVIVDSDKSGEDKYEDLDNIKDVIYDGLMEDIKDKVYDDLFEELQDTYYDGILDKCPDGEEYSDWYDLSSDDYSNCYDASSDVYELYYDTASDIYEFYYDVSSKVYSNDIDAAKEQIEKFQKNIDRFKN